TITIPATLTVEQKGWNATDGITAKVKSGDTFDSSKKLTVTAASANEWNLKSGENAIAYKMASATEQEKSYADATATTSLEISAEDLNTGNYEAPFGIVVEDYTDKPAGEYKDTVIFTAKVEDAVKVETLLTTLTFGGSSTYSETTSGVVSVTATNVTNYNARFGWLWFNEGSLSVTAKEGYTITKCVFIQNAKTPITDTEAPFEIHATDEGIVESTSAMDGVTSIEVYGYEN
ncbi:hypothetical protein, partial [Kandleria vitulina]